MKIIYESLSKNNKINVLNLGVMSTLFIFILVSLNLHISNYVNNNTDNIISSAMAQIEMVNDSINQDKESKEDNDNKDITTIRVQIDKNNIINNKDINDNGNFLLKIVGTLNGEGQIKYIDLNDINQEIEKINQNEKFLKVDLKFNKSNYISSTMVDDEYFVCAYLMKDNKNNNNGAGEEKITNVSPITPYDCDEGNIGQSTTKDSVTLFSTMKKFGESKAFHITNQAATVSDKSNPDEVKVTIKVPVYDAKDIDDMSVVAMIKGEYQIKTIDVQEELEEEYENDIIPVQFIFDRHTEVGPIQVGDLFFGCATSDEFPNQNSDCEKRMLKNLDKVSKICARKDNKC